MYLALLLHVLIQRVLFPSLVNRRWWAEARALLPQQGATNWVGPVSTWSWSGVKWRGSEKHIRTHKCIFFINVMIFWWSDSLPSPIFWNHETSYVSWGPPFFRAPPQPGPRTFGSYRPTWTAPAWQSSRGEAQRFFDAANATGFHPKMCKETCSFSCSYIIC